MLCYLFCPFRITFGTFLFLFRLAKKAFGQQKIATKEVAMALSFPV